MPNFFLKFGFFCVSSACVRDWSGILCELFRTTDNGQQTTEIFERGGIQASKDIAESPTAEL